MPLGIIERFGGKVLAWSSAIVLILALVGLLVSPICLCEAPRFPRTSITRQAWPPGPHRDSAAVACGCGPGHMV